MARKRDDDEKSGEKPRERRPPRAKAADNALRAEASTLPAPHHKKGERVAKTIARAGLGSRREAEEWVVAGRVAVNGATITSPALNVTESDAITIDGRPLPARERTRLYLYHKPRGLVTTNSDPEGRGTIFEALPSGLPRLISVGRLDLTTEGLLLLTNDGGLARVLELPETGWLRRYRVRAHGRVTQPQLDALRDGIEIEGIQYGAIEATLDREQGANVWLTFAIREGKNREVRNVLEHLGLAVNRLIRVSFGPFQLGELTEGAVEEIKTPHLREQLGPRVTALAGADFTSPIVQREPDTRPRRAAAPEQDFERPPAEREASPARAAGGREDRREGPRGKGPREAPRHGRDDRRPSGARSFAERPPRRDGAPGGARGEGGRGDFKGSRGRERPSAGREERRPSGERSFADKPRRHDGPPSGGRDERREGGRGGFGKDPRSGARPSSGRDERRSSGERSFGDKPRRHDGPPAGGRDDRREGGRGGFGKGPPGDGARPSFGRGERPSGERSFGDKPRRQEGPSGGGRDDRREGGRGGFGKGPPRDGGRPSFGRDARPAGERSFGDKPRRHEGPSGGGRDDRREGGRGGFGKGPPRGRERPGAGRDEGGRAGPRSFGDAPRRYGSGDSPREERGPDARAKGPPRKSPSAWRDDDRPGKRTFHGPRRDEASAESEPKRAKRSGPIQDRKGRRVLVERVPPQAPERTAEPRPEFKPRYKPRPGAKPTAKSPRDRGGRGGPRPSRPR